MDTKKVLIIEDEEEIREGIRILLDNDEYTFLLAENGEKGLALLDGDTDLVILDIMMPGMDGIEVCKRIRENYSVPILFLSAKAQEADKIIGLKTGADDYLTKPFSITELNARVKALIRRYCIYRGQEDNGTVASTNCIDIDDVWISLIHNQVIMGEQEVNLTETEYQILLMLMKRPNRSCSTQMIYEEIWNEPYFYGANATVMVHIKNLRQKIENDPQKPEHIITVWGKGYMFRKKVIE